MDKLAIDLPKLKYMIKEGINAIPNDTKFEEAVLVIGDTGVGKSTILSYLSGADLYVRIEGIKPVIDNKNSKGLKIGHDKFSQTSVPTKVVIDNIAYFDCPGFKDNKGEEFEISNSFFIQRLLDIYKKIKILLVIDESHITEARADKLPKLTKSLLKAFNTFDDIKDGVVLIINRADKQQSLESYNQQIRKLIHLKGEHYLFQREERGFLEHLIEAKKIFLFRSAEKVEKDKKFNIGENNLKNLIKSTESIKSRHIENILSESAKLAIRDYIDQIAERSNEKIEDLCEQISKEYLNRRLECKNSIKEIIALKEEVVLLLETIKQSKQRELVNILLQSVSPKKIVNFEEDFTAIMFFKNIYDKTAAYYANLLNKIYSEISPLLAKFDKQIISIQEEEERQAQKDRQIRELEEKQRQRIAELEEATRKILDDKNNLEQLNREFEGLKLSLKSESTLLAKTAEELQAEKAAKKQLQRELENQKKALCLQNKELQSNLGQWREKYENQQRARDQIESSKRQAESQLKNLIKQLEFLKIETDFKEKTIQEWKQLAEERQKEKSQAKAEYERLQNEYLELQKEHLDHSRQTSKKSKYEEVVCPHFKNGGKCIHCINKWKKAQESKNQV